MNIPRFPKAKKKKKRTHPGRVTQRERWGDRAKIGARSIETLGKMPAQLSAVT